MPDIQSPVTNKQNQITDTWYLIPDNQYLNPATRPINYDRDYGRRGHCGHRDPYDDDAHGIRSNSSK